MLLISVCTLLLLVVAGADVIGWNYRLVGDVPMGGRLEVAPKLSGGGNGDWGTVCSNTFARSEARAACASVSPGFYPNAIPIPDYGGGTGPVYWKFINCVSTAETLENCTFRYNISGWSDCSHENDVGIDCVNGTASEFIVYELLTSRDPTNFTAALADLLYITTSRIRMLNWTQSSDSMYRLQYRFTDAQNATQIPRSQCDFYMQNVDKVGLQTFLSATAFTCNASSFRRPDSWEFRVGGGKSWYGRLELRPNATSSWGTVCDDKFSNYSALAACHSLGINTSYALAIPRFGGGNGTIYMDDVFCFTNDHYLQNCSYTFSSADDIQHDCSHKEDVGVNCYPQRTPWEFRLGNSSPDKRIGRLEVRPTPDAAWGTVCSSGFTIKQNSVTACHSLGFNVTEARPILNFGGGNGTIYMNSVFCTLQNYYLEDCHFQTSGDCSHFQDVGVDCGDGLQPNTDEWQFRLVGGDKPIRGRLEVNPGGAVNQWGTVCDDGFDAAAAAAACRSLGFNTSIAMPIPFFGGGNGTIFIDDVLCNASTDMYLQNCSLLYSLPNATWHDCRHYEDVGVDCSSQTPTSNSPIILFTAVVDVYNRTEFTAALTSYMHIENTRVKIILEDPYGGSTHKTIVQYVFTDPRPTQWYTDVSRDKLDYFMSHVDPTGMWNLFGISELSSNETSTKPQDMLFRMSGGTATRGLLEVRANSTSAWGTVCGEHFDVNAALAVCHSLGYTNVTVAHPLPYFGGNASGPIYVDHVFCNTTDFYFQNCSFRFGQAFTDCTHAQDTGVECVVPSPTPVPPFPPNPTVYVATVPSSVNTTQVLVNISNHLGIPVDRIAVFSIDKDPSSANVSFFFLEPLPNDHSWSRYYADYAMRNIDSDGLQSMFSIVKLTWYRPSPTRPPPESWEFRLGSNTSARRGRLEVRPNATAPWGTVCDDYFYDMSAVRACHSLGFYVSRARAVSFFGGGTGPIYMDDVHCLSTEYYLQNCTFLYSSSGIVTHNCHHLEDVGVDCTEPPKTDTDQWQLRIVGLENNTNRGRLEMRPNATALWGTVCDDKFGPSEALAACHSLGFTNISFAMTIPYFGGGHGTIYLDDVQCNSSTEYYLQNCSFAFSTASDKWNDCSHYEDVGIDCAGVSPTSNEPVIVYSAVINQTEQDEVQLHQKLATYMWVNTSRILIMNAQPGVPYSPLETVTFRFTDPAPENWHTDYSRADLDYFMNWMDARGLRTTFGILQFTSNATRHTRPSTWEFRVAGQAPWFGRLEVRPNSTTQWGTVCSDYFDSKAAVSACHSLGFNVTSATVINWFGGGNGTIYLDDVQCKTTDAYLQNCSYVYSSPIDRENNCRHYEDVGLNCYPNGGAPSWRPPAKDWQFRLVLGSNDSVTGRLEVRPNFDSPWGTVCDDGFNSYAALAACHSLGFNISSARPIQWYGGGSLESPIYMDGVSCNASTYYLPNCSFVYSTSSSAHHDCGHWEDVGVHCGEMPSTDTTKWQFRIGGDETPRGRLEMRPSDRSEWGTICDDNFDEHAAVAACHSLGFTNVTFAMTIPYYGGGTGPIYLDDVTCANGTRFLQNCTFLFSTGSDKWNDCSHHEDVGIDCSGYRPVSTEPITMFNATLNASTFNLTDMRQRIARYLLVNESRIWILAVKNNTNEGTVVVSFEFRDPAPQNWYTKPSRAQLDFYLHALRRSGLENLFGFLDLVSNATRDQRPTTWQFRLSGSWRNSSGRLEARPDSNAAWGTVCDDGFNSKAALAACHSLGFNISAAKAHSYGSGNGTIFMDDVTCNPNDFYLQNCSYVYSTSAEKNNNCLHREDVGVDCDPNNADRPNLEYRLGSKRGSNVGRLEVRPAPNMQWGTVCGGWFTNAFNDAAALAACHSLGFTSLRSASAILFFGAGTGPIYISDALCNASTFFFDNCSWRLLERNDQNYFCFHANDVGVDCTATHAGEWQLRIAREQSAIPWRGRLELRPSSMDSWGTVCSDNFNDAAALAACHSLGYTNITAAYAIKWYGGGNGTIYLDDVICTPSQYYLQNCSYAFSTPSNISHNCRHWEDVAVDCSGNSRPPDAIVVYTATVDAPGTYFTQVIANWLSVNSSRIMLLGPGVSNGTAGFVNITFRFTDSSPAANTSFSRADLDFNVLSSSPLTLEHQLGIYKLVNNNTAQVASTMQFRLTGGRRPSSGRLEVRPDQTSAWGCVCDDGFNKNAAISACHSLGYSGSIAVVTYAMVNNASTYIFIDDTKCQPTDFYFQNCSFTFSSPTNRRHDCTHTEDVHIDCDPGQSMNWTFQVLEGNTSGVGLLLARPGPSGHLGTVCGYGFDNVAALAACRSAGFTDIVSAKYIPNYPGGADYPIYIDDVYCPDEAYDMQSCVFHTDGAQKCLHFEDVGVDCRNTTYNWQFRIVPEQEKTPWRGRLEVRPSYSNEWGTVCSDNFNDFAALAACHSLGLIRVAAAYAIKWYGGGNGTIYMDNVVCAPTQFYLQNCSFNISSSHMAVHDCEHSEDVAIDCSGKSRPPDSYIAYVATVRSPGTNLTKLVSMWLFVNVSRVMQIGPPVSNGTDGFVNVTFRFTDRQPNEYFTRSDLDYYLLNTPAFSLQYSLGIYQLTNNNTAQIVSTMELRLYGGPQASSGLLQARPDHYSAWGTVCDDGFDTIAALAVCHTLGFSAADGVTITKAPEDRTLTYIFIDDTKCQPTDYYFQNCSFTYSSPTNKFHDCSHSEDLIVDCNPNAVSSTTTATSTAQTPTVAPTTAPPLLIFTATVSPGFNVTAFRISLAATLGTSVDNIEIVSVTDGQVRFRFVQTANDFASLEMAAKNLTATQQSALGISNLSAAPESVTYLPAATRNMWIVVVVLGVLGVTVAVGIFLWQHKRSRKGTLRYDEDYIAMMDYR